MERSTEWRRGRESNPPERICNRYARSARDALGSALRVSTAFIVGILRVPLGRKSPLVFAAFLSACGGDFNPIPAAQAQAPRVEVSQIHFILRPDSGGQWFIQDDVDHMPIGVVRQIEQGSDYLRVSFDRTYTHAGVIQITSDDDFRDRVSGHSNLGLSSATIRIVAGGQVIDPARIWEHVEPGGGNLWVSVTMLNRSPN